MSFTNSPRKRAAYSGSRPLPRWSCRTSRPRPRWRPDSKRLERFASARIPRGGKARGHGYRRVCVWAGADAAVPNGGAPTLKRGPASLAWEVAGDSDASDVNPVQGRSTRSLN